MRTVEINGIKLEFDERTATTVEQYRIGSKVKVLVKGYGDTYDLYPGVIVGFADFRELPCIEVLYVKPGFTTNTDPFTLVVINEKTEGIEIAPLNDLELLINRAQIVENFDASLRKQENELEDMRKKRDYFVEHFAQVFEGAVAAE